MPGVRPYIELRYGRQNEPIRIPIDPLLVDAPATFLTADVASGTTTLTVANGSALDIDQGFYDYLIIGQPGNQLAELLQVTDITGNVLTLSSATSFPHSASTPVYGVQYNQVELSHATTVGGSKTIFTTVGLNPTSLSTNYADFTYTTGYYYARFKDSSASSFSVYSDPIPVDAYTLYSARSIIDAAKGEINKEGSTTTLTDEYAFQQLDMFQTDVLKELKRWAFMQEFDHIIGQFNVGEWNIDISALDPAIADPNTNQSIYNIRVGTNGRLIWIDKAKWDDFVFNLAYSTLSVNLIASATTITLVDSSDFNHLTDDNTDGSGTIIIGGNSYDYSANNITTGVLTLSTVITADNTATAGQYAFQNANQGLPQYYTVFDGTVWYWPITSAQYDGLNAFMDYYIAQTRIRHDSDEIVVPDALAASYFLQWKFLKKMNNGLEDEAATAAKDNYLLRREKLKSKETLNRTFKLTPRFQNFAIQEQWDSGDPRYIRDGNFPNTGF